MHQRIRSNAKVPTPHAENTIRRKKAKISTRVRRDAYERGKALGLNYQDTLG